MCEFAWTLKDKVLTAISQAKLKEQLPEMIKRDNPQSLEDNDESAAGSSGLSDLNAEVRKVPCMSLLIAQAAIRTH